MTINDLKQKWWSRDIDDYTKKCAKIAANRDDPTAVRILLKLMTYTEQRYPNVTPLFNAIRKEHGIDPIEKLTKADQD